MRVLLIGASIGNGWNFPGLPARAGLESVQSDYLGHKGFDKSEPLRSALARTQDRPDVIILKECSTYFPGDMDRYEGLIREWVKACRDANVLPVLATVAPVVENKEPVVRMKVAAKRLLGMPTRNPEIAKFNDWVKDYARTEGLEVLDIEAVVRKSDSKRVLSEDCSGGDRVHLNAHAYQKLDSAGVELIRKLQARKG